MAAESMRPYFRPSLSAAGAAKSAPKKVPADKMETIRESSEGVIPSLPGLLNCWTQKGIAKMPLIVPVSFSCDGELHYSKVKLAKCTHITEEHAAKRDKETDADGRPGFSSSLGWTVEQRHCDSGEIAAQEQCHTRESTRIRMKSCSAEEREKQQCSEESAYRAHGIPTRSNKRLLISCLCTFKCSVPRTPESRGTPWVPTGPIHCGVWGMNRFGSRSDTQNHSDCDRQVVQRLTRLVQLHLLV